MRIHCFQHVAFEGLGCIEDWITKKGHHLKYTSFFKNDPLPHIDDYDILIVMGGPMSFDDDAKYSWMTKEREHIKTLLKYEKTILGICLGAQLIADAIDGSARHGISGEIGWFPVKFYAERKNKGLDFIPDDHTVLHWHGDTFKTPANAVRLASTREYPNQAFLYRNNVMGMQFHIEMDEKSVRAIVENIGNELAEAPLVQDEQQIMEGLKYVPENNKIMWRIMDFLESNTKI